MKIAKTLAVFLVLGFFALIAAFDIWGALTLGTITPDPNASRDENANRVVMVFGATGSVGDGLLKAAIEDPDVEKVYVITRRTSPRIDAGVASGRVEMLLHKDFTDYSSLADVLGEVNTVLWGLGTSSLQVDAETYTWIHVDFPVAFVKAWLAARTEAPMAFHYVTGMGTGEEESARWAQDKGRAEREVAELAEGSGLRTFGYRSAYIRPTTEQANVLMYIGEALLKPGKLVITSKDLGGAMLEISTRTKELPNGTLIDNADSIAYAAAYRENNPGGGSGGDSSVEMASAETATVEAMRKPETLAERRELRRQLANHGAKKFHGPDRVPTAEAEPVRGEVADEILEKIIADLVAKIAADRADIEVLQAESLTWNDGSLGCGKPGQIYTQALVPGYRVILGHAGQQFDYRATERGLIILCEQPTLAAPGAGIDPPVQ